MIILGLNGSASLINENRLDVNFYTMHDAGAALIDNGKIVCTFEEERLNRIKHTNKFPVQSIKACLERYNISITQVDAFAFPREEANYDAEIRRYGTLDRTFRFRSAREYIGATLEQHFGEKLDLNRISFVSHHLAHAASAYYLSGFDSSLVVALDGWGDDFSGGVYEGKNNEISTVCKLPLNGSLGLFYLEITRLLGFDLFDEYKVMGLAPYGNSERYKPVFDTLYNLGRDGSFELDNERIKNIRSYLPFRNPGEPIMQDHMDIAAALQYATEAISMHIIKHYQSVTAHDYLCLAGGVALNCTMTGKLLYENIFKDIFVQPASNDGGLALGAALATCYERDPSAGKYSLKHVFLGNDFPAEQDCAEELERWKNAITFYRSEDIPATAARLIADGNVIGWFQGASEYGPRALGNRSILADPRPAENKALINKKIKNREGFRPFAPSLLEERLHEFFELPDPHNRYSFMTFILKVKEAYRSQLGAITHVDGTARLHTVSREINPRYYQLISCFGDITGIPVLLNTSFNNNCEPIVDTPRQAINCFLTTHLDYLIIGDYIIQKVDQFEVEFLLSLHPLIPRFIKLYVVKENGAVSFEMGNTYNAERHRISGNMYTLLKNSDGSHNFQQLMSSCISSSAVDIIAIIEEIRVLWALRLIQVIPEMVLTSEIK